jgi:hypothetical protein
MGAKPDGPETLNFEAGDIAKVVILAGAMGTRMGTSAPFGPSP